MPHRNPKPDGLWHEVRHRKTGEVQHVSSLDGYPTEEWEHVRLERAPLPHYRHVGEGRLEHDAGAAALEAAEARWNATNKGELMLLIERLEAEVAALKERK